MTFKLPSVVEENIQHFTGRAWLLPVLLEWLRGSDERLFVLKGGPGTGKSMIAAWLAGAGPLPDDPQAQTQLHHIRSTVKAVHFCTAASGNTAPRVLAQNMAQQLAHNVPGFADALAATFADQVKISARIDVDRMEGGTVTGVHIEHLNLGGLSDEASFNRTLREPLQRLYAQGYDEPMLLLIDALDEAVTYSGKTNVVSLLSKLEGFPEPVRFLATTRPDPRVRKLLRSPFRDSSFDLTADAPPDVADVQAYVYARLAWLGAEDRRRLAGRIAQAAEGNFLYAHLVVDDLSSRRPEVPDLDVVALPEKLGGLYHEFLNRELGADEEAWYDVYRPILGLIAVAKGEGLTREQLERFTGQDVERPLRVCKQYLDGDLPDGPFRPFHKSLTDFLLQDKGNLDYHIDARKMHRQIANSYWETCRASWADCDAYSLRHLLSHLVAARQWPRLAKALADFDFLEAQVVRMGIDALLLGLAEIVGQMPFDHRRRRGAKDLLRVLDREAHNLRDWDRGHRPAFLAQQVRNRAVYEGFDQVVASANGRLSQLGGPYLALAWRTYRESASMQRSLVLPKFYAMTVAVLPNGRVLSGGTDRVLRIWDPQTGRLVSTLPQEHEKSIRDVAVTPDGRHAITASFDATLRVWDLENEQAVATLAGHGGPVRAVAVTPDGRYAVSAADDATLRVWNLAAVLGGGPGSDAVVHILEEHSQRIWGVTVTSDGHQAVSVSDDGQLIAWDLASGESAQAFTVTGTELRSVAAVPGGSRAVVGDKDGVLTLLDLEGGQMLCTLEGHASSVFGLAVTADGTMALSASDDNTLRVWDLESQSPVQTLTGHGARVFDVAVSPDGRWAISAATDAMLKVWQLERDPAVPKQPRVPAGHAATVRSLAVTPDAALAVSAAQDGTLRVWEVESGRLVHALGRVDRQARHGHGVAMMPDSAQVVSATEDTALRVWDLRAGALVRTLTRSPAEDESKERNVVRGLAVAPDGRCAVSAAADGRLTIWDLPLGQARRTREGHTGVVRTVVVTAGGKQAISGGEDGVLKVWDLQTETLLATLALPGSDETDFDVRAVSLLPDRRLLAGHEDGSLVLWDVDAEAVVARWQGEGQSVRGVAVTEDGRLAIAASADRRVRALDLRTGQEVAAVFLEGSPCSMAFAQEEAILLIGDRFGSVYCLRYVGEHG